MKHSLSIKIPFIFIVSLLVIQSSVISSRAQDPALTPQIELTLALQPYSESLSEIIIAQVARFEAETGIKVSVKNDYGENDYQETVEMFFHMETPFDVFYVDNDMLDMLDNWAMAGYMLPLDGLIADEADFYPSVLDSVRVNGSLYCIPKNAWSTAFFYNRDSFDKAGLDYPTNDWTWDDLRENAQLLLEANSEPLLLDNYNLSYWLPFLHQAGGRLTNTETGAWAFNSTEGLESLTFYLDLYQTGRVNVGYDEWSGDEFSENRAGMIIEGSWFMRVLLDYGSTVNWGAVEPPSHHTEGSVISTQCYGISANTQNQEASLLLANFLTNAQSQTDLFSYHELPSRMSLSDAYMTYWVNVANENGLVWHRDDIQAFFNSLNFGFRLESFKTRIYIDSFESVFSGEFEQVINGEITPQDMLDQMEAFVITDAP